MSLALSKRQKRQAFHRILVWFLSFSLSTQSLLAVAELPVPSSNWNPTGDASRIVTGNRMTIEQGKQKSVLNWDSYNVCPGCSVNYRQPNADAASLNLIHQNSPSKIAGSLTANGKIYLINQNGILFANGAQINVGGLVASSLGIDDERFIEESLATAINEQKAALSLSNFSNPENGAGAVEIESGVSIVTTEGGQVIIAAPEIINNGSISTPGGQTILASGEDVFLASSLDSDLVGLLVEVNKGGSITNGTAGEIVARRGNITLAGLAVNQEGRLTATTSVNRNGTIRLLARDTVDTPTTANAGNGIEDNSRYWGPIANNGNEILSNKSSNIHVPRASNTEGGSVKFGKDSVTEILPEVELALGENKDLREVKVPDAVPKSISMVDAMASEIVLEGDGKNGAEIKAQGGTVQLIATGNPFAVGNQQANDLDHKVEIQGGAKIDVSGVDTARIAMERNSLQVELRGSQLADKQQQKDGVLRGETVYFDIRDVQRGEDGNIENIDIADINAEYQQIPKGIEERLAKGGKVDIVSEGAFKFDRNATIDISGGQVSYDSGYLYETQVVSAGREIYISDANPLAHYDAVLGPNETYSAKWGEVIKHRNYVVGDQYGAFVEGYTEGKSAGELLVDAHNATDYIGGTVIADTVIGPYQREGLTENFGGRVLIDLKQFNNATQAIEIVGEDKFKKMLALQLDHQLNNSTIISDQFFANSASNIKMAANGQLLVDRTASITMGATGADTSAGVLAFEGAGVVMEGSIVNVGGDVTIRAEAPDTGLTITDPYHLVIKDGASIDTSGRWINDNPNFDQGNRSESIAIDAGDIELSAFGDITVEQGTVLTANGGAWLTRSGNLIGGDGGDIGAESGNTLYGGDLKFNGAATSYSLAKGGQLSLTDLGFDIVDGQSDFSDSLGAALFQSGGFSAYELNALGKGIRVHEGVDVVLSAENYQRQSAGDLTWVKNQNGIQNLFAVGRYDAAYQVPVDLTLRSGADLLNVPAIQSDISLGSGSSIRSTTAGSEISLSVAAKEASISLTNADIIVPGGVVNMTLNAEGTASYAERFDRGAIKLGRGSTIDVSAIALKLIPEPNGIQNWVFNDAGSINLLAKQGYILAQDNVELLARGAAQDVTYTEAGGVSLRQGKIGMAAGAISLAAAEGIISNADYRLDANGGGKGGTFSIMLDANSRGFDADSGYNRQHLIVDVVSEDPALSDTVFNSDRISSAIRADEQLDVGVAYVNTQRIRDSGADNVLLTANNVWNVSDNTNSTSYADALGQVRFSTTDTLSAGHKLALVAPAILANGHDASVRAPYLVVGVDNTDARETQTTDIPMTEGRFLAEASFIEMLGAASFQDATAVTMKASDGVRLRGSLLNGQVTNTQKISGELNVQGDLQFETAQIFSGTNTDYMINVLGDFTNSNVGRNGFSVGSAYPVLSAGSAIRIEADNIYQNGVIKSPVGKISLTAPSDGGEIRFGATSLTSTSGESQLIPYGRVNAKGEWLYNDNASDLIEYSPENAIALQAASVEMEAGSVLDFSGEAELLATEFVPGPGGSKNVLDVNNSDGAFAIVPGYSSEWAPHDFAEWSVGTAETLGYEIGQTLRFESAVAGLDASRYYAVMPAQYALLPGAYLVTPHNFSGTIRPGQNAVREDGASIVAGVWANASTHKKSGNWNAFVVEPGTSALKRSELNFHYGNTYFPALGASAPGMAGSLSIKVEDALSLNGKIVAKGVGGTLDITADNLALVNEASHVESGMVEIQASTLSDINVESILLGGTRAKDRKTGKATLTVESDSVYVGSHEDQDSQPLNIEVNELVLAANNRIEVRSGTRVAAKGPKQSDAGELEISSDVQGDFALLQVSTGSAYDMQTRLNSNGDSGILVAQDALISADGANLFAANSLLFDGDIATGNELSIHSPRLAVGEAQDALVGQSSEIGKLLRGKKISLVASESITFNKAIDISLENLTIDTPIVNGNLQAGEAVSVAASGTFQWKSNGNPIAEMPITAGAGTLNISADTVMLGGGINQKLLSSGFSQNAIHAQSMLYATSDNDLEVDGDIRIQTPVVSASPGNNLSVMSDQNLLLTSSEDSGRKSASLFGLGSVISFEAEQVSLDTQVLAPSGRIDITSRNDLMVGSNAYLDVSGRSIAFSDGNVDTPAGEIRLQSIDGDISVGVNSVFDMTANAQDLSPARFELDAHNGSVDLQGTLISSDRNAALEVDTQTFVDFGSFINQLGAFGRSIDMRQRQGDFILENGQTIASESISIEASAGSVDLAGSLDASGAQGGDIGVYARQSLVVRDGAVLSANSTDKSNAGGAVLLSSTDGEIQLHSGSVAELSGSQGGYLILDAKRTQDDVAISLRDQNGALAGLDDTVPDGIEVRGAAGIQVQARKVWQHDSDIMLDREAMVSMFVDGEAFYAAIDAESSNFNVRMADLIGQVEESQFRITPTEELQSTGSIVIDEVDLATIKNNLTEDQIIKLPEAAKKNEALRYGEYLPGKLVLRAQENITVQGYLSDGFVATKLLPNFPLPTQPKQYRPMEIESWSFELTAGADMGSANSTTHRMDASSSGDVYLNENSLIRTGTGDINISAAGDLVFENEKASIYTGGRTEFTQYVHKDGPESHPVNTAPLYWDVDQPTSGELTPYELVRYNNGQFLTPTSTRMFYPKEGGDVAVSVAGDIFGSGNEALSSAWLQRIEGDFNTYSFVSDSTVNSVEKVSTWGVNYDAFNQDVGTLGGGSIAITTGGSLIDIGVATATNLMHADGAQTQGGGDITIMADGDLLSPYLLIDGGELQVISKGSIMASGSAVETNAGVIHDMGLVLVLGNGANANLRANDNLLISTALDVGMIPQPLSVTKRNYYFNEQVSALSAISLTGDVELEANSENFGNVYLSEFDLANSNSFIHQYLDYVDLYPNVLDVTSVQGSINVNLSNSNLVLKSSDESNLRLRASKDLTLIGDNNNVLGISPFRIEELPLRNSGQAIALNDANWLIEERYILPTKGGSSSYEFDNANNKNTALLEAKTGDLYATNSAVVDLPIQTVVKAGMDIENLTLHVTHNDVSDVTSISAGRDIHYPNVPGESDNQRKIELAGPGSLLVSAGRNIDLGTSAGIKTTGDTRMNSLPDFGADLYVLTGVGADGPDYSGFMADYFSGMDPATSDRRDLLAFIAAVFESANLTVNEIAQATNREFSPEFIAGLPDKNVSQTKLEGLPDIDKGPGTDKEGDVDLVNLVNVNAVVSPTDSQKLFMSLSTADQWKVVTRLMNTVPERGKQLLVVDALRYEVKLGGMQSSVDDVDSDRDGIARSLAALGTLFAEGSTGNLNMTASVIKTEDGGDLSIVVPAGDIDVGLPVADEIAKPSSELGILAARAGEVSVISDGNININRSRIFALDGGDMLLWSSYGDIDAGRGAKTALTIDSPRIVLDPDGNPQLEFPAAVSGSGIQSANSTRERGSSYIFAPNGVIDAGDAGIRSSGDLLVLGEVVNADNINVGGVSIGVPTATPAPPSLGGAGDVLKGATDSVLDSVTESAEDGGAGADQVAFLTVEIIGLGD